MTKLTTLKREYEIRNESRILYLQKSCMVLHKCDHTSNSLRMSLLTFSATWKSQLLSEKYRTPKRSVRLTWKL